MTINEAIKHCEDKAEEQKVCNRECSNEHKQLASWLRELVEYRKVNNITTE